jgi:hypothetical protein
LSSVLGTEQYREWDGECPVEVVVRIAVAAVFDNFANVDSFRDLLNFAWFCAVDV